MMLHAATTRACAADRGPVWPRPPAARSGVVRSELLLDLPLEVERPLGQIGVLGLDQIGIEAAAMVDAAQRMGRDPQPHRAAERFGHHGDVEQIRQKAPFGLDVGMAYLVPDLRTLATQLASPRHRRGPLVHGPAPNARPRN